jgi:putative peptidoglycan lipid II flippase
VLIGVGNVTSRLLGLVREQVIAALFGATGATSAFRTATRVSTAVYDLLLSGAMTSALVPVFSDYTRADKAADLSRIVSTFVNLTLVGLGAIVAVFVLGAGLLVGVLGADPDHFSLAVDLTRLALPSILLLGVSGILTSVLYARREFARPAFAGAVYNIGFIVAATMVGSLGIYGLAVGLSLGAVLQILLQLSAFRGLRYQPIIDLRHPGVRLVLRLYAPVFLGMVVSYGVVVIDTHLAWRTGPESVAAMVFATTLVQFPLGLVGAAASLAILPTLTRMASGTDPNAESAFAATLVRGIKIVVLLIVPAAVVLVALRDPTVSVLFERLAFDAVATKRTALAFLAYAPQLPFVVVDQLLIVAFYARKQTTTPVVVGVIGATVYLGVALGTVAPLGMPGLALANTAQNSAHAVVLYALLARRYPVLRSRGLAGFGARVALAGLVAAIVVAIVAGALSAPLSAPALLPRLAALVAAGAAAVIAYWLCLTALRVPEVGDVVRWGLRRVRDRRESDAARPDRPAS